MADETDLAPAENDDLRSTLAAAFEASPAAEPEASTEAAPEAAEVTDTRARDELGRFAPKTEQEAREAAAKPLEQQAPTEPVKAAPEAPQGQEQPVRPPPGWSVASKAEFDKLSPHVKADIVKREVEVNQGLAKLQEYKPVERFAQMAREGGTTLEKALESYTGIEQMLRSDIVKGIGQIAQNLGVHPVEMAQKILAAYGQQPNQTGQQQSPQITPDVQALLQQQLAPLQRTVQQLTAEKQAQSQAQVNSAIERFFADPANKYAENLSDDMIPFINERRHKSPGEPYEATLKWAYERAAWANPEVRPFLVNAELEAKTAKARQAADQARAAARSITGSPTPGASVGGPEPAPDLRAELERQFAAGGGRL